jgi:hypothetical protein
VIQICLALGVKTRSYFVRFGALTAVAMKSSTLCDIKLCSYLKINPTFRRNIEPPFSGMKNIETRNQHKSPLLVTCFHADFFPGVLFGPGDEGNMFFRNVS